MKDGVFLEMMAECFQKLFASDEIKVSRNKKYYSKGKLIGEVDVVIEGVFDFKHIKIGTECRDRKGPQGRNWIRQIIGKRFDLAHFGFTDWIAISSGGFKSTAEELAERGGIRLLVPAEMKPSEPEKNGPHKWMQYNLSESHFIIGEYKTTIKCKDEVIDWVEEQLNTATGQNKVFIISSDSKPISFSQFFSNYAEVQSEKMKGENFEKTLTHKFPILNAEIERVSFKFYNFEIKIQYTSKSYKSIFKMTAFVIPQEKKVLGFIGLNEYKNYDKVRYLMFAMKPSDPDNAVMAMRNHQGKPVKNQQFTIVQQFPQNAKLRKINIKG